MITDEQIEKLSKAIRNVGSSISFLGLTIIIGLAASQCSATFAVYKSAEAQRHIAHSLGHVSEQLRQINNTVKNKRFYHEDPPSARHAIYELNRTLRQTLPVVNTLTPCSNDEDCSVEGERCTWQDNRAECRRTIDSL